MKIDITDDEAVAHVVKQFAMESVDEMGSDGKLIHVKIIYSKASASGPAHLTDKFGQIFTGKMMTIEHG